ncbi:MAG: ribonuclease HII [Parachlamydiaceae bacterium]
MLHQQNKESLVHFKGLPDSVLDPEQQRLIGLTQYEQDARCQGFRCIAGIDEAGRGPLAGPVVAAACIIPDGIYFRGIDDSKKLTSKQRESLFAEILSCPGVNYGIGVVSHEEIDRVNIYQATILAMLQAVSALKSVPDYLLVDGMSLKHPTIPSQKIIRGDAKSQSIAAASVLAKVTRDRMMQDFDRQWPEYGFGRHKGYGTAQHCDAISAYGPCPIHRMTFAPLKK